MSLALQAPRQDTNHHAGQAVVPPNNEVPMNTASEDALAHHLRGLWSDALQAKRPHEERLFESLAQRRGKYDSAMVDQLERLGANQIFFRLTEMKCRAAKSWINDVIKNSGSNPWTLDPTPVPELPVDAKERIAMAAQSLIENEGMTPQQVMEIMQTGVMEEVQAELVKESKEKAKKMATHIDDQLTEGKYWQALDDFVDDFVTFHAAFLMGPITEEVNKVQWVKTQQGPRAQLKPKKAVRYKRVSPFDVYPMPHLVDVNDGGVFVREAYTNSELWGMQGLPGADPAKIDWLLRMYGDSGLHSWLDFTQDDRRDRMEGRHYQRSSSQNKIDALRYMGEVQGHILTSWGVQGVENTPKPYQVEAILINNLVIRVTLNANPTGRKRLFKASLIPSPGSFWGQSLPEMMADHQEMVNHAARSLAENMSMASGPQVAVSLKAVNHMEDPKRIHAWKVWLLDLEDEPTTGGKMPVEFFQPDMNANELFGVINSLMLSVDQVTGIPAYLGGVEQSAQGGAANTASGLSMLMSASAKGMREYLSEVGDLVRETIEELYIYNMLYHPDESIKGDAQIKTGGFVALMQKETTQMRRQEFLAMTNNPVDLSITGVEGRRAVMREAAGGLEMDVNMVIPDAPPAGAGPQVGPDGMPLDPSMQGGPPGAPPGPAQPQPGEGSRTADGVAA